MDFLGKTVLPSDYKIVLKPDKCEESIDFNVNGLINRMKDVGIDYAVRDNEMAEQFIMETRKGIFNDYFHFFLFLNTICKYNM